MNSPPTKIRDYENQSLRYDKAVQSGLFAVLTWLFEAYQETVPKRWVEKEWVWTPECQSSFDAVKQAIGENACAGTGYGLQFHLEADRTSVARDMNLGMRHLLTGNYTMCFLNLFIKITAPSE